MTTPPPPPSSPNSAMTRRGESMDEPPPSPPVKPRRSPVCGRRHRKRVQRGRILGGHSALPGAHPWVAALYIGSSFCAGTLITSCWLLSAAHCFLGRWGSSDMLQPPRRCKNPGVAKAVNWFRIPALPKAEFDRL